MNFYDKKVDCDSEPGVCVVTYTGINSYNWNRIKKNSLILAEHGIGPKIYRITENPHTITYQWVNTLSWPIYHPTLTREQLREQALAMVDYMHNVLDIAHTDLAPENIGYIGEKLYFIDHDELFRISEGGTHWVRQLIEMDGSSFEELVDSDYRRFDQW